MADQVPPETPEELNEVDSAPLQDVDVVGVAADPAPPVAGSPEEGQPELPDRIRVHALAKLLGVKSKQILAALTEIGAEARSPQSSVARDVAESVRDSLAAGPTVEPTPVAEPTPVPEPTPVAEPEPVVETEVVAAEPEPEPEPAAEPEPVAVQPQLFASPVVSEDTAPITFESAGAVAMPLFLQPDAEAIAEVRRRRKVEQAPPTPEPVSEPEPEAKAAETTDDESTEASSDDESADGTQPKRRRRGRRGRGRGRGEQAGGDAEGDETDDAVETPDTAEGADADAADTQDTDSDEGADDADSDGADDENGAENADGTNRRRRRRRRRKVTGDGPGEAPASEDDPPNTVVHEREPRNKPRVKDEVQGISGSTRLEAKRQRRRDGRDAGRRRPPILTESEFLARREAVDRVMVVRDKLFTGDGTPNAPVTQVAVLEDDVLVEHFVTSTGSGSMVGNVYLGRVQNVLPSMEAAFVDIGRGRNGVLYAGEVNWEAAGLGGNSRKIEQALNPGDQVLVQISKDPVGHKGARLTTQISLAGRFLVYVPGGTSTGISRKLPDTERKRLKEILRDIVPNDAGVIIRTASEGVSAEELQRDVERLQNQWKLIDEQASAAGKGNPQTLYEEPDLLVKVIRDLFNEDFSKIVIEGEKAWSTVENYIRTVAPDLLPRVHRHDAESGPDVFETYRIDEQLAKALDRKVWLPSGGTLVIDRTEAMTVVDVNTGKFTGAGGNLEETVTRNNLEAAEEIVRQMRLRDIGGMIVVDFIDMVLESNRDLVLRRLTEALGRDRTRHQVSEVTSLGLVQMTRKKLGTGLIEAFSTQCEHCHGRGLLVHSYPVEPSSSDEGSRGPARGETTPRKRRGRQTPAGAETPEPTPNGHTPEVDPAVRRAHPVALAMAAHHHEHDHDHDHDHEHTHEPAAVVEAEPSSTSAVEAPVAEVVAPVTAPEPEPVAAAPEPKAEPEPVQDAVAPKKRAVGRRRVSRATSAPVGEASAGTVIVIPAHQADAAPAEKPVYVHQEISLPPRAPRRRAVSRPAGPPVEE